MDFGALSLSDFARNRSNFPLDQVSGSGPIFAYGTKKLISSYNGSAFRVVRASDAATLDIGFVGGVLDQNALNAFLAGTTGKLDIWYDQTGNGFHATQTTDASRPVIGDAKIGGVTAPYFLTYNMVIPVGAQVARTSMFMFSVFENATSNGTSSCLQLGSGATQATQYRSANTYGLNPGGAVGIYPQAKPCVQEFELTASARRIREDDVEVSSAGGATAATLAGGTLANTDITTGYNAKGYMAAIIAYSRTFTAGELSTIRSALAEGFKTTIAPGRVIFAGDSIAATSTAGLMHYGYAKQAYRQLSSKIGMYNLGIGGVQLQTLVADFNLASGAGNLLPRFSDNRIVFLHAGTNDLTVGARTAAQIYADMQSYAGLVRAAGGKIIVSTLLPNVVWNATQQTTRNDLNALIVANWASFADGLADFAADPTMGPQAAAANSSLYVDGLHPTILGNSYLALICATEVNKLI